MDTDAILSERTVDSVGGHPTTIDALRSYAQIRDQAFANLCTPSFFVSLRGKRLIYSNVCTNSVSLAQRAGLCKKRPLLLQIRGLERTRHSGLIQRVLAIPQKRFDRNLVTFLTPDESEALIAATDPTTWVGRRDRVLMELAIDTGLHVSELVNMKCEDVVLQTGPHVRCLGKGRKQRCTPLSDETVRVLRTWLKEHKGAPSDPLFPSRRGGNLSRDAVERLVTKYAA